MAKTKKEEKAKVTTVEITEVENPLNEKIDENVVNIETPENTNENDISEILEAEVEETPKNVETVEQTGEDLQKEEQVSTEELNEEVKEETEELNEELKEETEDDTIISPTDDVNFTVVRNNYVASAPIEARHKVFNEKETYVAQCPPKPDTANPNAYVAQRPY